MSFRPGAQWRLSLGITVTFLGAAGCAPVPEAARYSVPEYQAYRELRRDQLKACAADPGALGKTPDCVNAREAERLESTGSFRELPAMGLPTESGKPDKGVTP